jgi:hypothetical protein
MRVDRMAESAELTTFSAHPPFAPSHSIPPRSLMRLFTAKVILPAQLLFVGRRRPPQRQRRKNLVFE